MQLIEKLFNKRDRIDKISSKNIPKKKKNQNHLIFFQLHLKKY